MIGRWLLTIPRECGKVIVGKKQGRSMNGLRNTTETYGFHVLRLQQFQNMLLWPVTICFGTRLSLLTATHIATPAGLKIHSCPRTRSFGTSRPTVQISDNLSALGIILRSTSRWKGFISYLFDTKDPLNLLTTETTDNFTVKADVYAALSFLSKFRIIFHSQ